MKSTGDEGLHGRASCGEALTGPAEITVSAAACRLPTGITSPAQFNTYLLRGQTAVTEVPADRWGHEICDPTGSRPGTTVSHCGSFLDNVTDFDAKFFGIGAAEAAAIDPQQRVILEVAWEAMRTIRPRRDQWAGSHTAAYVGLLSSDYRTLHTGGPGLAGIDAHYATGTEASFAAGRLAHLFDLRGPALSVATACSSSLVAVTLAADALRGGHIDAALVCGVSLLLAPELSVYMSRIGALSPSGTCRPFAPEADGIIRGEGCAVVVLERTGDVLRTGRRPLATIRCYGTNHDGYSAGLTAPNANAQVALLSDVLSRGGLRPDDLDYVEAHGTGTPLGDSVELAALAEAVGRHRTGKPLLVGSHKANFGHLDAAAGLVGLLKALGVVRSGSVPPQPHLADDVLPGPGLRVPTKLVNVAPTARPIRVGVSAFGLSGTNAHIVLESFDPPEQTHVPEQTPGGLSTHPNVTVYDPGLTLISAHSANALTETVRAWTAIPALPPGGAFSGIPWADNPHAARTSLFADHGSHRIAAVGPRGDRSPLLRAHVNNEPDSPHRSRILSATVTKDRNLVLLLPGEISAWDRDALAAVLQAPAAQEAIDRCIRALPVMHARTLRDVLALSNEERNTRPQDAYLAAFTAQYAISCRLHDDGLRPTTTVSEGLGRLTAAVLAGHIGLPETLRLLLAHADDVAASQGCGRTVVVHAAKTWLQTHLSAHDDVRVVSDRGVGGQVVCGSERALRKLESRARAAGVPIMLVDSDHALHPLDPCALPSATDPHDDLQHRLPAILCNDGTAAFLEVGGSGELANLVRTLLLERDGRDNPVHTLGTIMPVDARIDGSTDGTSDDYARALANLWVNGVDIGAVTPEEAFVPMPELIPPPTWEHRCYWSTSLTTSSVATPCPAGVHPNASPRHSAEAETATAPQPDMPAADRPAADAAQNTAGIVNEEIRRALGIPTTGTVPGDHGLFELGLDSLGAVEVGRRLAERLGVPLPTTILYEHPTLHALVEALDTVTSTAPPATTQQAPSTSQPPVRQAPGALAIVGMAYRLPGASTDAQLWDLLSSGASTTRDLPVQRPGNHTWVRCGPEVPRRAAWLDGIDQFDHRFFRMSPAETCAVDPQQRLLLEVAWEALENAGIPLEAARHDHAGVYVGLDSGDYAQLCARDPGAVGPHFGTGTSPAATAGRLSYALGLTGPAVAIDSACSSSLAALHAAGAALRDEDCNLAFVGAANLVITPTISAAMGRAGALAADGRCKPFSAGADGYGRGDGVICLLVKTLQRALDDSDRIHAVVEATAVNQNGASGGFTVPAQVAQERLIRQALRRAKRTPGEIVAVEAHGTGTRLGDPIELRALASVFSGERDRPLAIGAVKASLGHLEAAAGLAGIVKLILCYRHGTFPKQPLPDGPTPHFEWKLSPLETSLGFPLRPTDVVGLSSFGFSGTNAHAVVSGPYPTKAGGLAPTAWIVPMSAHTPEATRQRVLDLADAAATLRVEEMAAVVSTLTTGRTHLPHRTYVAAQTNSALLAALRGIGTGAVPMPAVHDVSHRDGDSGSSTDFGAITAITGAAMTDSGAMTGEDLGRRFIARLPVDWMAVARGRAVHPLPAYPWQHASHWIPPTAGEEAPTVGDAPSSRLNDASPPPVTASRDRARDTLLATIAAVAENLGMAVDDVDPDVGFFDLGMDSVQAVAVCRALSGRFDIDLEATATFEHPNCRQLGTHIADLTGTARATHGITDALAELDLALNRTHALLIKGAEA